MCESKEMFESDSRGNFTIYMKKIQALFQLKMKKIIFSDFYFTSDAKIMASFIIFHKSTKKN